jgi:hypothetical protein
MTVGRWGVTLSAILGLMFAGTPVNAYPTAPATAFGTNGSVLIDTGVGVLNQSSATPHLTNSGDVYLTSLQGTDDTQAWARLSANGALTHVENQASDSFDSQISELTASGTLYVAQGSDIRRFDATNALDLSYGAAGVASAGCNGCSIEELELDSAGRLLLVVRAPEQNGDGHTYLRRLLPNGGADMTFGSDGIVYLLPGKAPATWDELRNLRILADGTIFVLADSFLGHRAVFSLTDDGTSAARFGSLVLPMDEPVLFTTSTGGVFVADPGVVGVPVRRLDPMVGSYMWTWGESGRALALPLSPVDPPGEVEVVAQYDDTLYLSTNDGIVQYVVAFDLTAGQRKTTFGANGRTEIGSVNSIEDSSRITSLGASAAGVVAIREHGPLSDQVELIRLDSSGAFVAAFGKDGRSPMNVARDNSASQVVLDRFSNGDSLIVVENSDGRIELHRHDMYGEPRTNWAQRGKASITHPTGQMFLRSHVVLPDDSVAVLATASGVPNDILMMFSPSGTLQPSFGRGGQLELSAVSVVAGGTALEPVLFTIAQGDQVADVTVSRLDSTSGSIDVSFGGDGSIELAGVSGGGVYDVDGAGRLWWAEASGAMVTVHVFTTTGVPDMSFPNGGRQIVSWSGFGLQPSALQFDDGMAYVLGVYGNEGIAARLTTHGIPDLSYGSNGLAATDQVLDELVAGIEVSDGEVTWLSWNTDSGGRYGFVRLDRRGRVDEKLGRPAFSLPKSTFRTIGLLVDGDEVRLAGTVGSSSANQVSGSDAMLIKISVDAGGIPPSQPLSRPTLVNGVRLLSTRGVTADGRDTYPNRLTANQVYQLQVGGRLDVPVNAKAAVLNISAAQPVANGFVTVSACGALTTAAASMTFRTDGPATNEIVVPLTEASPQGSVCIIASAETHFFVDLTGYFAADAAYRPLRVQRFIDTRPNPSGTFDGQQAALGRRAVGVVTEVQITGRGTIAQGVLAVVGNLSVVRPATAGYVTAYSCDDPRPVTAAITYQAERTVSNEVTVKVSQRGTICLFNSAETDVTFDVVGTFDAGGTLSLQAPQRSANTLRDGGATTIDGLHLGEGPLAPQTVRTMQLSGRAGVPATGGAVLVNVTVVRPQSNGYVTVYSCGSTQPSTATIAYSTRTTSNEVVVQLSSTTSADGGTLCAVASSPTDLVLDVVGVM